MNLPLYRDHGAPLHLDRDGHAGLWWEKFFSLYNDSWEVDKGDKSRWIETVSGKRDSDKSRKTLKRFVERHLELGHHLNAQQKVFETQWQFVTGLGISHPVENGFSWHPTLGLPYLPGSAVKGLLRAWVEEWIFKEGQEDQKKQRIHCWFGRNDNEEQGEKANAGDLIFFDALPVESVETGPGITTPHVGDWLEKGDTIRDVDAEPEKVPADWHSPVPITFLVVKQAKFLFQIAPRGSTNPTESIAAMKELEDALEWLGAGAKAAVGYGRMVENEAALRKVMPARAEPTASVAPTTEVLELVEMQEEPQTGFVLVETENGGRVRCTGLPAEAKNKWNRGDKLFQARVSRQEGAAVNAVWAEWGE